MRVIVVLAALFALVAAAPRNACRLCLYGPDNMTFDRYGNMYLTDSDQHARNRLIYVRRDGTPIRQWDGFTDAPGAHNGPEGLAIDRQGRVLVTDGGVPQVFVLAPFGHVFARIGPPSVRFHSLGHVAVAPSGRIYVCDGASRTIIVFDERFRRVATWTRPRGRSSGDWEMPESIAVMPNGDLVLEDWANRRIDVLSPDGSTLREIAGSRYYRSSAGVATDASGSIYVADIAGHRIVKFDARGRLVRYIGHGIFDSQGPSAVAVDRDGVLYSPDGLTVVKYTQDGRVLARWS